MGERLYKRRGARAGGLGDDKPFTADDWDTRAEDKRAVALAFKDDKAHCREAWHAAGTAFEFLLKARIMRYQRLNSWPSREARPDLYTHGLRQLMAEAGLDRVTIPANLRGAFKTALDWDRSHDYRVGRMPRKVARGLVDAVFGEGGIDQWMKSL